MEITGKFEQQFEVKTGQGQKGAWEATSFMIEVPGQYPKHPVFELFNNTDAIVGLKPGQQITVSFDIDSSEWNSKRFAKVRAYKVVREGISQEPLPDPSQGGGPALSMSNSEQTDLPF